MFTHRFMLFLLAPALLSIAGCSDNISGLFGETTQVQITSTPERRARIDRPYAYAIQTEGAPTPDLTVTGLPDWLTFDGNRIVGTPRLADIGETGTITVTASNGTTDSQQFRLTVAPQYWFVRHDAPPGGNGGSWETALSHPQDALDEAYPGEEVWVAEGPYTRRSPDDAAVLTLVPEVPVYGGFRGTESQRSQRIGSVYPATLSGEGSHRVVIGASNTTLDGFIIANGRAPGVEAGGGFTADEDVTGLKLADCYFVNNTATRGGGTALLSSGVALVNCFFGQNRATEAGGAVHADTTGQDLRVTNCVFSNNSSDGDGGAVVVGGGKARVLNATFFRNVAGGNGGALAATGGEAVVINSILWEDFATSGPEAAATGEGSVAVTYSNVDGGWLGDGNINQQPRFMRPWGDDGILGTPDDRLRLWFDSPGVDAGTDDPAPKFDFDGSRRPQNGAIDMGAYEGAAKIWFVRRDGPEDGDGKSWEEAFRHPMQAMEKAGAGDAVWVAQQSYFRRPDDSGPVVRVREGVALYGGFVGTERDIAERDPWRNVTTLDGEDANRILEVGSNCVVDGLRLLGGHASDGAAIRAVNVEHVRVSGCRIVDNESTESGGGILLTNADAIIARCRFERNVAGSNGGAVWVADDASNRTRIRNCEFTGNRATWGGGVAVTRSAPGIEYSTFSGNSAANGGGLFLDAASPRLLGNIVWNNDAASDPNLRLVSGSAPAVSYCNIQGGFAGTGNIDADPIFIAPTGADGVVGTADDDLRLGYGSPCQDAADPLNTPAVDIQGFARPAGPASDMGANERPAAGVVYVRSGGTGNGSNWTSALGSIQQAVDLAGEHHEVWVAEGTYTTSGAVDAAIALKPGVVVRGGFAGNETSPAQRRIDAHPTVVKGSGLTRGVNGAANAVLDGLVIRAGQANSGGGLLVSGGVAMRIIDCVFVNNGAANGGAVAVGDATLTAINCRFLGNWAGEGGGAMMLAGTGRTELINCAFTGNMADGSSVGGGAILADDHTVVLTNCTFSRNFADFGEGGALYLESADATLINCILWYDAAPNRPEIRQFESSVTAAHCNIQGNTFGGSNISQAPLFVDVNGPDDVAGSLDDDVRLRAGSAGIDGGVLAGSVLPFDIVDGPRPQGTAVDMGAHER